ncbi:MULTISPECIES: potassium channel family protein [unclassified Streptomyces]|uniref:potassium channel family protein n=1 Tax=Streptomyces sp. NPDC048330 TaxID=3365533 RepID=UPI003723BE17
MDGNPGSRRSALLTALHAVLSLAAVLAAYYLLPLDSSFSAGTVAVLVVGVLLVALLIAWQVRTIMRASRPGLKAVAAVATALPFFVALFAATYFLLARSEPASFTEPMSRTDSLYFTMTVFSTVGFGDISPRTEVARLLTTGQMTANFLLIGVAARFVLGAVQEGRRLRSLESGDEEPGGPPFAR